jgi:signal transduction histidine kinase/CheY-like chemotaxis protein
MQISAPEKVMVRLDWRRERAYRVGLVLARLGAALSLAATLVNFVYSRPIVVIADILLCFGCLGTLFLTRNQPNRTLIWWPFYSAYWIATVTTLAVTGGVKSSFFGVFMALLFVGGVVIQSTVKATRILFFVLLNLIFWLAAESWLPVSGGMVQPAVYVFLLNGICLGAIGICIYGFLKTEQDLAEEFAIRYRELETAKNDLSREELANAAKSSFLANISHEFRTPLSVIIGYVEMLQDLRKDDVESQEMLSIVHRNGHQLARLVNDLLDLSKAEADRLEIEEHGFKLYEVLQQVRESLKLAAAKKNLELNFSYLNPVPQEIITDSVRLKQILLNLIGNAIKFTDRGSISVQVEYLPASPMNSSQLKICIIDTGRGLSEIEKSRLFKPFTQADSSTARKFGGTGLGLNLSKRLAELLGGDVVLSASTPNKGSCFVLTLKVQLIQGTPFLESFNGPQRTSRTLTTSTSSASGPLQLQGLRILIVDDILDNRILAQRFIQSAGGEVDFAVDGIEGVEKALKGSFDLVLMDIQMPGMSGLDATVRLRQNQYNRPIVALSAYAMAQDRERSLEAGCDDHLTKPIQKSTLVERIDALVQRPHP